MIGEAAPAMLERLWLCAPQWEIAAPPAWPGAKLVDSTRLSRIKEGPERRAATLRAEGIDAVNLHHTDWNGGMVALFHRFDRVTFGWDMQEPHILQAASCAWASTASYSDCRRSHDRGATSETRGRPAPASEARYVLAMRDCPWARASASPSVGQTTTKARPIRWSYGICPIAAVRLSSDAARLSPITNT